MAKTKAQSNDSWCSEIVLALVKRKEGFEDCCGMVKLCFMHETIAVFSRVVEMQPMLRKGKSGVAHNDDRKLNVTGMTIWRRLLART